jgi:hypothetical protein
MNGEVSKTVALTRLLVDRTVTIRILDHISITDALKGRVVRILDEASFFFSVKGMRNPPIALLVSLEHPLLISPGPDLAVKNFKYALLVAWDYHDLVSLATQRLPAERFSIHFYLLEEDKLASIHISPERDDLDVRWTYGISKEVEIELIDR